MYARLARLFSCTVNFIIFLLSMLTVIILLLAAFGIRLRIVVSDSMAPVVRAGDLVFVNERDKEAEPGEIILYALPENISGADTSGADGARKEVLHRLLEIRPDGKLITKGDANELPDLSLPGTEDIVGTYAFAVPGLGRITAAQIWSLCGGLLFLYAAAALMNRFTEAEEMEDVSKEELRHDRAAGHSYE